MPDKRIHRGKHPQDERLFAPAAWPQLQNAVADMSWLLSRQYAAKSTLKLVGDRFALDQRQRMAVMRSVCADCCLKERSCKRVNPQTLNDEIILLDGYNVITTIEASLAGGIIIMGRDGCYRDIASVHGTYRKVEETIPAINLIGKFCWQINLRQCLWYLDSPVSNSGRLKTLILEIAQQNNWNWQVQLVHNPDAVLSSSSEVVGTSDSEILNRCSGWLNLTRHIIEKFVPQANIIDLSGNMPPAISAVTD